MILLIIFRTFKTRKKKKQKNKNKNKNQIRNQFDLKSRKNKKPNKKSRNLLILKFRKMVDLKKFEINQSNKR